MIGALTYEEVLRATMRSNWIHALWLFAVVVLIWVCTILLTLYGNRKKKPKGKDDSWQVSAKKETRSRVSLFLEAPPGFEPGVKDLQSHALPLGYGAKKLERATRFELATSTLARWRSAK